MSDATLFIWFFAGLFVLRIIAATFVYAWLLSNAPECPNCGGETLRVQRQGIAWLFPRLRPSWCPDCRWEGLLQPSRGADPVAGTQAPRARANTESQAGQLPLISKKSSK